MDDATWKKLEAKAKAAAAMGVGQKEPSAVSGEPIVVEEADRYRIAAPERHVCDSHCAHYCPAPAQPVSAEAAIRYLRTWWIDGNPCSDTANAAKAIIEQNAALREELANERANIEALVAENTRLLEQVATRGEVIQKLESEAEAAEAELAEAADEWDEIHALLTKFGIPNEEDGSFLSLETRIERLAKRKLPSAEELARKMWQIEANGAIRWDALTEMARKHWIKWAEKLLAALQEGE